MVHDRDGIYGKWLPDILTEFEIKSIKMRPRCPWQNAYVERFNLSIKNEMLNRLIVVNSSHAQDLCASYEIHYNRIRPHQGIDGKIPVGETKKPATNPDFDYLRIEKRSEMFGLQTHFSLAA